MLQATLNGALSKPDHPAVPVTIEELAEDAVTCVAAGPSRSICTLVTRQARKGSTLPRWTGSWRRFAAGTASRPG